MISVKTCQFPVENMSTISFKCPKCTMINNANVTDKS